MIKERKNKVATNLLLFAVIFIMAYMIHRYFGLNETNYYWDASVYYDTGKSMFADGHFSFEGISYGSRGFYFPFFLGASYAIDHMLLISNSFYFISSVVISILAVSFINFSKQLFCREDISCFNSAVRSVLFFC